MVALVEPLIAAHPTGRIFRNNVGTKWTNGNVVRGQVKMELRGHEVLRRRTGDVK
jgi:hypothetical protein